MIDATLAGQAGIFFMSVPTSGSEFHRANGKVALLVDGDNVSAGHAGQLLLEAGRLGAVTTRRVYGINHGKEWVAAGFSPVAVSPGKNATDMVLAIDAVDLKHRVGFETMVIASSDQDFAPLAHFLREAGVQVIGMGGEHAPSSFRLACSDFVFLKSGEKKASEARTSDVEAVNGVAAMSDSVFEKRVTTVFSGSGKDGFLMKDLGIIMGQEPGLMIRERPEKNWRAWFTAHSDRFDLYVGEGGPRVRLRPNGKAPSPKA